LAGANERNTKMTERISSPKVAVLAAPGVNRDIATKEAYERAGASAEIVHMTQLRGREKTLEDYQILSIPGGFSYGDHIQAGRVIALEFRDPIIADQIYEHLERGRIILGVCNGFQALVQSGLLPFGEIHPLYKNKATLTNNKPDRFQSRWIYLKSEKSVCEFVDSDLMLNIPLASGEGRFLTIDKDTFQKIQENGQVVCRYCSASGEIVDDYSTNPNGSEMNIAAICDPSGQILGMMPHAEDFVRREHHPNWRRMEKGRYPDGLRFFERIVAQVKR
jgi:phosphoribosylformylglycinamidine synthase